MTGRSTVVVSWLASAKRTQRLICGWSPVSCPPGSTSRASSMMTSRDYDGRRAAPISSLSDLGPSRLYDDVASAAHDRGPSVFLHDCDQGNVIDKVYVQEKRNFLLCEASSYGKETAMEGFRAASADGLAESASVFGSEGTDFDAASVPQRLFRRESSCFRHGQQTPDGSYSRGRVRLTISTLPPIVQRETMTM